MSVENSVKDDDLWSGLSDAERREIKAVMRPRKVARGEMLIEHGSAADALFVVGFGLFEVIRVPGGEIVAEIGTGGLVGEIGFFAGESRTASVVAARDSEVLEIDRATFDELAARLPAIQRAATRSLAKRLAKLAAPTRVGGSGRRLASSRMVVALGAGAHAMPAMFLEKLRATIAARPRAVLIGRQEFAACFGGVIPDRYAIASWLAELEQTHDLVICAADPALSDWTQATIRSADELLIVAVGSPGSPRGAEAFALDVIPAARRRLVRVHERRSGLAEPSAPWLHQRDVFMVHQVALEDDRDFRRLARFLAGQAIGFVAGGGGGFGPAHVGIYKALCESGVEFDIHGGSSIGAAMAAAFSLMAEPEDIEASTQEIFVRRRALKRFTLPRYGFLDHTALDEALRQRFGQARIEDLWIPYFAVATDLSNYSMRIMRSGLLWQAIRASCAIPGVLPPFYDEAGHMLVDGGVADNVPVAAMKSLKSGPNVVVDLRPRNQRLFQVDYQSIPGRWTLLARLANPFGGRTALPRCPGPASVIQRSLFGNVHQAPSDQSPHDLLLRPPAFPGSSFMNWERHRDVLASAYQWGRRTVEVLREQNDPALAELEKLSRAP